MTHHDIVQILCGFPHAESLFVEAVTPVPTIQTGQDHSTNGSFLNGHRHLEENVSCTAATGVWERQLITD